MSNHAKALVIQKVHDTAKATLPEEPTVADVVNACMDASLDPKHNWLLLDDDTKFQAGICAVAMHYHDDPEKCQQLKDEIDLLKAFAGVGDGEVIDLDGPLSRAGREPVFGLFLAFGEAKQRKEAS
jgi:hypothetical protein